MLATLENCSNEVVSFSENILSDSWRVIFLRDFIDTKYHFGRYIDNFLSLERTNDK